jgi:predicted nucleotidyltransferase
MKPHPETAMEEFDVLRDTVFLTLSGSKAYGTSIAGSDEDRRGVCILKDKRQYYGLQRGTFKQKDSWESGEDCCIYDFIKATQLMMDANPNMLDLLFENSIGSLLRRHGLQCTHIVTCSSQRR